MIIIMMIVQIVVAHECPGIKCLHTVTFPIKCFTTLFDRKQLIESSKAVIESSQAASTV
jgi:hypothetical protein